MNGIVEERMSNTPEYEFRFRTTSYDEYKKVREFCQKLSYERKNNNLCDTNPFGDDKFGGLRMTKKKAIAQLENLKEHCNEMSKSDKMWESDVIALDIAIETLKNLSELEILENASQKIALTSGTTPEWVYNGIINTLPKINADSFKIYSIKRIIKRYDDINLTISFEERKENYIKAYMEIKDYFINCK